MNALRTAAKGRSGAADGEGLASDKVPKSRRGRTEVGACGWGGFGSVRLTREFQCPRDARARNLSRGARGVNFNAAMDVTSP